MDLQQLLAAAQQMQDHLMSAQQELADAEVEGTSGGGLVKARVNGQGELVDLTISPAAVDPADPADTAQTIADLVLAAVRNAYREVGDLHQRRGEAPDVRRVRAEQVEGNPLGALGSYSRQPA